MATTYTLITSTVLSVDTASVTLSAIPNTYSDLVLRISGRVQSSDYDAPQQLRFNGSAVAEYSENYILGFDTPGAGRQSNATRIPVFAGFSADNATADSFANVETYITNYASANFKPFRIDTMPESKTPDSSWLYSYRGFTSAVWQNTAAITSITIFNNNWRAGSSFYLYGIQ